MGSERADLLQGTLGILILKALLWRSMHGYGIARWVEETTDDVLQIEEGSLYPALRRLEDRGLVQSEWGLSENNRRAKYYRLTAAGRARLGEETASWNHLAAAIARALAATPQGA